MQPLVPSTAGQALPHQIKDRHPEERSGSHPDMGSARLGFFIGDEAYGKKSVKCNVFF
jgi:hypothetical protein